MRLAVAALVLAFAGPAMATPAPRSDALVILDRAIGSEKNPKELEKALAELDALLVKNPKDPDAHYARGWILSRSGTNNNAAVAAYDKAFELDPRLADAAYNAGVVLGRNGNAKDAIVRFERALKVNPKHVDAAYNAGQSYYDLGELANAAARWETAAKLAPDDFQIAKKLVQAYVGLGRGSTDKAKKARDRVYAMRKANPEIAKLSSYVYDQFTAGKYHVYVYETFDPAGDGAYVYQAKVALQDKVVGSVTLELSKTGFALGVVDKGGEHALDPQHTWKKQPEYALWKALVGKTIEAKF